MSDNNNLDIFVKISQQLGEISGQIKGVMDKLANHESRLTQLEKEKPGTMNKDQIIGLLIKCLIIAGVSIASLTGAGSLLSNILK